MSGHTHPTPPQPQHPSPMGYGAPSPSLSAHSGGPTAAYPNGVVDQSGLPPQNGPQSQGNFPGTAGPRGYRSQSSSSGRTVGYQSSPGQHGTHVSPPMPMSGPPQQQNSDSLYRSGSDPTPQYPDQRHIDSYNPAQGAFHPPMLHPQHPSHPNSHFPNQHGPSPNGIMPPPTSLPPFSALDVHPTAHRPTVHIPPGGARPPFAAPLSPRKGSISSPTTTYNGGYASSGSHNYSPHSTVNLNGPNVYPSSVMHYPEAHGADGHTKQSTDPLSSSNVTSADSSEDESELPTSGMVAPFVAIRGLADKAEVSPAMFMDPP